jgi:hypothetical protein
MDQVCCPDALIDKSLKPIHAMLSGCAFFRAQDYDHFSFSQPASVAQAVKASCSSSANENFSEG